MRTLIWLFTYGPLYLIFWAWISMTACLMVDLDRFFLSLISGLGLMVTSRINDAMAGTDAFRIHRD